MKQIALDYLVSKYGLRLNLDELCAELKINKRTIITNRSDGKFPLPMFKQGRHLFASVQDVVAYMEKQEAKKV